MGERRARGAQKTRKHRGERGRKRNNTGQEEQARASNEQKRGGKREDGQEGSGRRKSKNNRESKEQKQAEAIDGPKQKQQPSACVASLFVFSFCARLLRRVCFLFLVCPRFCVGRFSAPACFALSLSCSVLVLVPLLLALARLLGCVCLVPFLDALLPLSLAPLCLSCFASVLASATPVGACLLASLFAFPVWCSSSPVGLLVVRLLSLACPCLAPALFSVVPAGASFGPCCSLACVFLRRSSTEARRDAPQAKHTARTRARTSEAEVSTDEHGTGKTQSQTSNKPT